MNDKRSVKFAPSILAADFARLGQQVAGAPRRQQFAPRDQQRPLGGAETARGGGDLVGIGPYPPTNPVARDRRQWHRP